MPEIPGQNIPNPIANFNEPLQVPKDRPIKTRQTKEVVLGDATQQPFSAETELLGGFSGFGGKASPYLTQYLPKEKPTYATREVYKAAFEKENTIVSGVADRINGTAFSNTIDPNFNSANYVYNNIRDTKYATYFERFLSVNNEEDAIKLQQRIDREEQNNEIIESSGWKGWGASLIAGIVDPINFIPVFNTASKSVRIGKLLTGASKTAIAGAGGVALTEGILQAQQETRTAQESVVNIAGGAVLGGILGGAGALLSKRKFNSITKKLEQDIGDGEAKIKINPEAQKVEMLGEGGSVGAAKVESELPPLQKYYQDVYVKQELEANRAPLPYNEFAIKAEGLAPVLGGETATKIVKTIGEIPFVGKTTQKLIKSVAKLDRISPNLRILNAEYSSKAKEVLQKLTTTGMSTFKNELGIANQQSVWISRKQLVAPLENEALPAVNKFYKDYIDRVKKEGGEPKKRIDFEKEITRAMNYEDSSEIPEVIQSAQIYRKTTLDFLSGKAENQGILKLKKFDIGKSYFPQNWNKTQVIANEAKLADILSNKIKNTIIPNIKNLFNKKERDVLSEINDLSAQEIELQDYLDKFKKEADVKLTDKELAILDKFKEAKKIIRTVKPKSLLQWIKETGGIYDYGGELKAMGITSRTNPGLLRKNLTRQSGQDDVALRAWEAGYFVGQERPTVNDLLDLIDREAGGEKVYSEFELDKFAEIDYAGNVFEEIEIMGYDIKNIEANSKKKTTKELLSKEVSKEVSKSNILLDSINPTGSVFSEYNPKERATANLANNITTLDKTMRVDPNKIITIYRGAPEKQGKIVAGDFITTNFQLAKDYAGDGIVLKKEVKASEILDDIEDPLMEEYIYRPEIMNIIEKEGEQLSNDINVKKLLIEKELELIKSKKSRLSNRFEDDKQIFRATFEDVGDIQDYTDEVVDSILANLKKEKYGNTYSDFTIAERGPLKRRALDFLEYDEIADFLNNDATEVVKNYARIMSTDIELAKAFDNDLTLQNSLDDIADEYSKATKEAKTPEERIKISKEKKRIIADVEAIRDILRGNYGNPEDPDSIITRTFQSARKLNFLQKMGGVVISSISDMANPIAIHGFKRWTPALQNLITNIQGIKLNVAEAKLAGNIIEKTTLGRMSSMAEIGDPFHSGRSSFERLLDNGVKLMSKINLMPLWNDANKSFSSVITQQRIINESINWTNKTIKENDRTYLSFLGIGENEANIINEQINKFGYKDGNLWVANTKDWDDYGAVFNFRNALNTDVERTIVSLGAGDIPLFMNKEIGKTIGQFKSFAFASTQQVLIARLQQKDMAALSGFISAISLGMLTYYLKTIGAGKEPSQDINKWIVEGIDRSGYLGILMEVNNISEKVTGGKVGINALIDGEVMSRYASRNITSTLLGPTLGQVQDATSISSAISKGEITETDVKDFRQFLPYQNLFYLRSIFDEMEDSLKETVANK
jgi:hypothetical protein